MAIHRPTRLLHSRHQRMRQHLGPGAGFLAGKIHQNIRNNIILAAQVDSRNQIIAVVAFGQQARGFVAGIAIQQIDSGAAGLALALAQSIGMQR